MSSGYAGYGGPSPTSALAGTRVFLPGTYVFAGDPLGTRHFNTMGSATLAGTVRVGVQGKAGFSGGTVPAPELYATNRTVDPALAAGGPVRFQSRADESTPAAKWAKDGRISRPQASPSPPAATACA